MDLLASSLGLPQCSYDMWISKLEGEAQGRRLDADTIRRLPALKAIYFFSGLRSRRAKQAQPQAPHSASTTQATTPSSPTPHYPPRRHTQLSNARHHAAAANAVHEFALRPIWTLCIPVLLRRVGLIVVILGWADFWGLLLLVEHLVVIEGVSREFRSCL